MPYTDAQIERIGTAYFLRRLYREDIKVARPDIDDGVALVAYLDREAHGFRAVPLQLKCYRHFGFAIDQKYLPIHGLKIAYLWHVDEEREPRIFLMDYSHAEAIVDSRGWTRDSRGRYARTDHTQTLEESLRPFEHAVLRTVLFPNG